jgi:hypothetical protein
LVGVRTLKFASKIDPRDEIVGDLKSYHDTLEIGGAFVLGLGSPPAFRRERSKGWFGEGNPTVCVWALFDRESGLSFIVGAGTSRITRHTYHDTILNRLDTVT